MGSGIVISSFSQILSSVDYNIANFYGVDINPRALEIANRLFEVNSVKNVKLIESNLFTEISFQLDIIIFNPPYVVTPSDELESAQKNKGIEASWAGGEHGI